MRFATEAITVLIMFTIGAGSAWSSELILGAWGSTSTGDGGETIQLVVIFTRQHQVAAWFDADSGKLQSTNGGTWSRDGNIVTETVEFDSNRPERVGTSISFEIDLSDDVLSLIEFDMRMDRIKQPVTSDLAGAWQLAQRDDATGVSEKTVRLMWAGRYQWIKFNPSTGQMLETRGGHYSGGDGRYSETVDFHSMDVEPKSESSEYDSERSHAMWFLTNIEDPGESRLQAWRPR